MKSAVARVVATAGYVGLVPGPSGAWASAAAVALAWLLHWLGGFPLLAAATAGLCAAGLWAARVEARGLAPRAIVVGSVVGQWVALWPLSAGLWVAGAAPHVFPWPGWTAGFALFRLLDVLRPWPVGQAARRAPMLGHVVAGAAAAVCVAAAASIAHGWLA